MWKKWFGKSTDKTTEEVMGYDSLDSTRIPLHIAIIMDGNGRWAQKRGLPRKFGHRAGVEALRGVVKTASEIGVRVLTAYVFSTENWKRPIDEVNLLMSLILDHLDLEFDELHRNNVKIMFMGSFDKLPLALQDKMTKTQTRTHHNTGLILNLAINYGSRAEITRAVQNIASKVDSGELLPEAITDKVIEQYLYTAGLPDPDLLIRPSGDLRISNYMLWQLAYSELWFSEKNWPDFTPEDLIQAIVDYQHRERRFGGLKK